MPARIEAPAVNGRQIHGWEGVSHWAVEIRGPLFEGRRLQAWRRCESLADAIAEAHRLGPMGDSDETDQ